MTKANVSHFYKFDMFELQSDGKIYNSKNLLKFYNLAHLEYILPDLKITGAGWLVSFKFLRPRIQRYIVHHMLIINLYLNLVCICR